MFKVVHRQQSRAGTVEERRYKQCFIFSTHPYTKYGYICACILLPISQYFMNGIHSYIDV